MEQSVKTIHSSWNIFFHSENVQKELIKIEKVLIATENTVYPNKENIFRCFSLPLEKVKVVLLGQDPYHDGNAVGLSFSVEKENINPSLKNMFKEMKNSRENGDLLYLHNQGVLLLNTALTVEKSNPGAHLSLWKNFTELLITFLNNSLPNVIWLLLGAKAEKYIKLGLNTDNCVISSHPSPLGASKTFKGCKGDIYPAFIGSDVFNLVNKKLSAINSIVIVW